MSPADVLDAAADLLERDGWSQFSTRDPLGRRCAVGALAATGVPPVVEVAVTRLQDAVGLVVPWNDRLGQTAENVIATMRRVATDLRAES